MSKRIYETETVHVGEYAGPASLGKDRRMIQITIKGLYVNKFLDMRLSEFREMLKGCQVALDEQAAEENAKLIRNGP